jgi:hypothetical protein
MSVSTWVARSADGPIVYGVVLAPGALVDGHAITADDVEKAAHAWMADASNVAKSASGGRVVSSMCAMTDLPMTDEGGRTHMVSKGAWVVGVKTDDASLLRQARSGELSFQPMFTADAPIGTAVTPRPITKQEDPPVSTTHADVFEEIRKSAAREQRPGETIEQAITRYVAANPAVYAAYRESSTPVIKGDGIRNIAFEKIEALAKAERGIHPELTREQAIAKVASDKNNRELVAEYSKAHYAIAELVEKRDYGREDARRTLDRLVDEEMARSHVNKAEAHVYAITTAAGREAYRTMLGLGTRERPVLPVSKSDEPYRQLQEVAQGLMKSDRTLTEAQAMLAACKARGDLYAAYDRAFKSEVKAAQVVAPRETAPASPSQPITKSSDAYRAIERVADGLIRSDPTLTKSQAIVKAAEQNPGLYRQYRAEADAARQA